MFAGFAAGSIELHESLERRPSCLDSYGSHVGQGLGATGVEEGQGVRVAHDPQLCQPSACRNRWACTAGSVVHASRNVCVP